MKFLSYTSLRKVSLVWGLVWLPMVSTLNQFLSAKGCFVGHNIRLLYVIIMLSIISRVNLFTRLSKKHKDTPWQRSSCTRKFLKDILTSKERYRKIHFWRTKTWSSTLWTPNESMKCRWLTKKQVIIR